MARSKWLLWVILAGLCLSACGDTSPTVVVSSTLEATATVKLLTTTPSLTVTTSSPVQTQPVSTSAYTEIPTTAYPLATIQTTFIGDPTMSNKTQEIGAVYVAATSDSGDTWTPVIAQTNPNLDEFAGFERLECIALKTCMQVGITDSGRYNFFDMVREGSKTWRTFFFYNIYSAKISCLNTAECWKLNFNIDPIGVTATKDGGKTWVSLTKNKILTVNQANLDIYLKARRDTSIESELQYSRFITCVSSSKCLLIGDGGRVIRTIDSGQTWEWFFTNPTNYNHLVCPDELTCYAVNSDGISLTRDFGETWNKQAITSTTKTFKALSCPSITNCFGLGDNGSILATYDKGMTWNEQTVPKIPNLADISCPNNMTCYLINSENKLLVTKDAGKTWATKSIILDKFKGLSPRISCPTSTNCYISNSIYPWAGF